MRKIYFSRLKELLISGEGVQIERKIKAIIDEVREGGDKALQRFTREFDGVENESIRVSAKEIESALKTFGDERLKVFERTAKRIEKYHLTQMPKGFLSEEEGLSLEYRFSPIQRVGIYIPAGQAPLFSTILMSVIPAQVAGVKNIFAASPPSHKGKIDPLILGLLGYLGITNIFAVGGAQAIAAFAYGTETIPAVDVVAGPGNRYVNTAKKLLYGRIGIDAPAGPSELVIFSDGSGNPDFIAADMEAQIEHTGGLGILITQSEKEGRAIAKRVKAGFWIKVKERSEALEIINYIAPEHLQLMCIDPFDMADKVIAGAVFIGDWSATALGDYFAGPSHVLPTGRSARYASGLSVYTFLRSYAVISAKESFYSKHGAIMERLPLAEGLEMHRKSLNIRIKKAQK